MTATKVIPAVTLPEGARPRSFVWLCWNGRMNPAVWFDDPRVGVSDIRPVAERKLEPDEYGLSLDDLAAKYPAPEMVS